MIVSLFPKILSLVSLFFIIVLGVIVIRNSWKLVNKLFLFLTLSLIVWLFGSLMLFNSTSSQQIIFWDRFIYAGVIFWVAVQYHFSLAVTSFNRARKNILISSYLISFIFLILSRTEYFISGIFYYAWGAHMKAQMAHHFLIGFFFVYSILFFYVLVKKYRQEKDKLKKNRILFYIISFSVLAVKCLLNRQKTKVQFSIFLFPLI